MIIKMFIIYYCNGKLNDMSYDIKVNKEEKDKLIHRYSLDRKGDYKELWENNVCITLSKDKQKFQYIEDISCSFKKNKLIQEVVFKECLPYNFYKVHQEDIYQLYEKSIGDVVVQLKEYDTHLTLSTLCNHLTNFYELDIF